MRKFAADIRTLEWTDALQLFLIAGIVCSMFMLSVIWSGNLP